MCKLLIILSIFLTGCTCEIIDKMQRDSYCRNTCRELLFSSPAFYKYEDKDLNDSCDMLDCYYSCKQQK